MKTETCEKRHIFAHMTNNVGLGKNLLKKNSFIDIINELHTADFKYIFSQINEDDICKAISKEKISLYDFIALLSPCAEKYIENIAAKAKKITEMNFGKIISLYSPVYLSDYCINQCVYCGFNCKNDIERHKLDYRQAEIEAEQVSSKGIRHVLLLAGESRVHSPVEYIEKCVRIFKKYFSSVSIEIYPLETHEYKKIIDAGAEGLTIYQEVYDKKAYETYHLKGPKKNYHYRLDAPERGCAAGMRVVNIGALLGLSDWRKEAFFTGLHALYLQNKYPHVDIGISLPRIRKQVEHFNIPSPVSDFHLVQIMTAMRLLLPRAGINISTRERRELRENLIGLGVTRMSAGSSTRVGGHSNALQSAGQFEISDNSTVEEVRQMIYKRGYQPVFKDWDDFMQGELY